MARLGVPLLAVTLWACSDDAAPRSEDDVTIDMNDANELEITDDLDAAGRRDSAEALRAYCGEDWQAVEDRLDELLAELTLAEKVGLMAGAFGAPLQRAWETPGVERLGVPPLRMLDGPRGVSLAAGNATAFPVAIARGATWDVALEERVGEAIGREVRAKRASVVLAPMLNLVTHPRWGRAQEGYGEDPFHVGALGVAFIEGAQRHVIASAKHFAANNIENTRFDVDVTVDERTLREVYLPQFRRAVVDAHVGSVMSAYNSLNGTYCSENVPLLRGILKGEWAFQGFVESDWFFATQTTVGSAEGGLDIEMPTARVYGDRLLEAVQGGEVEEAVVDEAVRRVLRATLCFELDVEPPERDPDAVESPEHLELALQVARRSLVLLKNDGATLPIDASGSPGAAPSIAVLGPLAEAENIGDTGSSNVIPSDVVTVLEGLTELAPAGAVTRVPDVLDEAARQAVREADAVVMVVGLTADEEGEGLIGAGDRESLGLPVDQVALIEAVTELSDRVVVVLEGGSAIAVSAWIDRVEALVMAWYPGQMGGRAVAEVLLGEVNPSGRLPLSVPVDEADLAPFDNVSHQVTYPRAHGYRYLDEQGTAPQYPFGFGLSYTRFELGELDLSSTEATADDVVVASVEVTNVGNVAGLETVQLYVGAPDSALERVPRELKGFAQVALEPGRAETVRIELPVRSLAYWSVEQQGWLVEATDYRIEVGTNARDLASSVTLTVTSEDE